MNDINEQARRAGIEQLLETIARLPPKDCEYVLDRFNLRAVRLDWRDDLIRELRTSYAGTNREAARKMSADFQQYLCGCWRSEQHSGVQAAAGRRHRLYYEIACANRGRSLGPDQLDNIFSGSRNPEKEKF